MVPPPGSFALDVRPRTARDADAIVADLGLACDATAVTLQALRVRLHHASAASIIGAGGGRVGVSGEGLRRGSTAAAASLASPATAVGRTDGAGTRGWRRREHAPTSEHVGDVQGKNGRQRCHRQTECGSRRRA